MGRGKASLGVMVGSPGAVDSQDLDADQIFDGEESSQPTLQARAAINQPSWVSGQTWELGIWGHTGTVSSLPTADGPPGPEIVVGRAAPAGALGVRNVRIEPFIATRLPD